LVLEDPPETEGFLLPERGAGSVYERMRPSKIIAFDCDSTLSGIEGIDEMARLRGAACFAEIDAMTRDAMEGRISLDSIFARRLDIVRPTRAESALIGQLYIKHVEPTALATLAVLRAAGWTPLLISGGYMQAIEPLATFLGIDRVEAVGLRFDLAGNYAGYEATHPASQRGGKPRIIHALREELKPEKIVMVGDGASDLETKGSADVFVGFGRYVTRPAVKAGADRFVDSLAELPSLLIGEK
jgi:phosphoserine phosphatase